MHVPTYEDTSRPFVYFLYNFRILLLGDSESLRQYSWTLKKITKTKREKTIIILKC